MTKTQLSPRDSWAYTLSSRKPLAHTVADPREKCPKHSVLSVAGEAIEVTIDSLDFSAERSVINERQACRVSLVFNEREKASRERLFESER